MNRLLIAAITAFLSYPAIATAQAPNLGTATSFAAFTINGAFTNTGATVVTGDIGNNSGAITGFPPGIFVGTAHEADGAAGQASTDILNAYSFAGSLECSMVLGTSLGAGQILFPGVYCISGVTTIDGSLILDAMGDPDGLFIFQVNSAMSTTKFSRVLLINGASRENVYWQVNGAVSLGDSSAFRGTLIASGAISLLEGAAVAGRVFTISGALALHNNIIIVNDDIPVLPVTWLSLEAGCENQHIIVTWSTAIESNNDYFSIERSINGIDWQFAGQVKGAGNSSIVSKYSFPDQEAKGSTTYYRIRQTDRDGKFVYSRVITAQHCNEAVNQLTVHPSPGSGIFALTWTGNMALVDAVSVYDVTGKKVFESARFPLFIDLTNKADGVYFLHLQAGSQLIIKRIVIKK